MSSRAAKRTAAAPRAAAEDKEPVPFGYTRKDVLIIGLGLTLGGFGAYSGLQNVFGMDPVWAGQVVQLTLVLGLTLVWVGSYVWRVFNKDMTYVKQLKDYEEAVLAKRLEEIPEAELEALMSEIEQEKAARGESA